MKIKILALLSVAFFMACSESESETKTDSGVIKIDDSQTVSQAVVDTVKIIEVDSVEQIPGWPDVKVPPQNEAEAHSFLSTFLTPREVTFFDKARVKYPKIKKDTDLINFYLIDLDSMLYAIPEGMRKSHPHVEYSGDSEPAQDWAWLNDYYPYIYTDCPCSECESEGYAVLTELSKKAVETDGDLDNLFFDFLLAFNGDYTDDMSLANAGNVNNWFTMDGCDFCSFNNLGDGNYTNILEKIIIVEKQTKAYDEMLKSMFGRMNYVSSVKHFGASKQQVLAELNGILLLKLQTRRDLSDFEKLKRKLESGETDIQFDCKTGDCTYDY